jgi:hypothetical protein
VGDNACVDSRRRSDDDRCEDNHVKAIGTSLSDFSYDKAPGASTGTLHIVVDTVFNDDHWLSGSLDSHELLKIRVLGIKNQCKRAATGPGATVGCIPTIGVAHPLVKVGI